MAVAATPVDGRRPWPWGLFRHGPVIVLDTGRDGPAHNRCECGWSTLPVPRRYFAAVIEAEERHLRELDDAIADWHAGHKAT